MFFKLFKEEKPVKSGPCWYKRDNDSEPRIALWDQKRKEFKGDRDSFGYHSYLEPIYWLEIETPIVKGDNSE